MGFSIKTKIGVENLEKVALDPPETAFSHPNPPKLRNFLLLWKKSKKLKNVF